MDVGSSAIKRPLLDLDPNYKDGHITKGKRRCLVEETGQEQTQQRMVEVVVRELDEALAQKEDEALQLQERVQTCQRDLHLLRFGITSSYFRNFLSSDVPSTSGCNEELNPLHPAVLHVMGYPLSNGPKTRGVRYKTSTQGTSQEPVDGGSAATSATKCEDEDKEMENDKRGKQEEKGESTPTKVPRYVPPNLPKPPEVCAASVRMERHRIKRRLVVGNISKWLPEDIRESAATHKWMLYLRGPKDSPDVSDIVAKVRYFLHPSYRPHDIVDVVHPFYLARRGWGEFPVRVQVHFILQENRPIDIIYNLKLDRTYSGLQTLGGETVVDVWLKNVLSDNVDDCSQESESRQDAFHEQLDALAENSVGSSDWHETVAHETQELIVATAQLGTEEEGEEIEDKTGGEMEVKKENEEEEEEDDEEDEEEEEEEEEEDYEEEEEEDGDGIEKEKEEIEDDKEEKEFGIQTFLQVSQVKKEDEICHVDNTLNVLLEETSKTHVEPSDKGFVLHTFPDHDYLGCGTFTLKCTLCFEQHNSDGIKVKTPLKAQMMQATNKHNELSWSSSVPPPLVLIQKSNDKLEKFPVNTMVPSDHTLTLVKMEAIKDATKMGSNVSVPRNSIASNSSLVQCVDAEGNIIYISLQKPNYAVKPELQKDALNSSSNGEVQHPTGRSIVNNSLSPSINGTKTVSKNSMVVQKNMGSVASSLLQTGRSLLKKNYMASPSTIPSNTNQMSGSDKHVEHKPKLSGSSQSHVKVEHEKSDTRLEDAEQVVSRIADDRQAVTWILQQLPLADARVKKREFRRQHPYCARNVEEFLSWPIGKRHCSERLRANAAQAVLQKSNKCRFAKWSVRHIINWSRLHALTPLPSLKKEQREMTSLPAISSSSISSVTEPLEVQDWLESIAEASKSAKEMEIVNVDELIPTSLDSKISPCFEETSNAVIWLHPNTFFGKFLRNTAAQLDIKLKPEMLCPGVMYPAAEQLLNKACQSLCEDLLRKSLCQAWGRCKERPNDIVLMDVQNAILSRSEFDIFTNGGLGVQAYDSFKYS